MKLRAIREIGHYAPRALASLAPVNFPDLPRGSIQGRQLSPLDFEGKAEPYLLEIEPHKKLPSHFFAH